MIHPEHDDLAPDDGAAYEPPSKSQRKRDMHALQDLGEQLVALSLDQLKKVPMPDSLADAVREAKRITSHEGRRRQMQYVGKLMRDIDPAPIAAAIAAFDGISATEIARHHRLERLRARLIEDESVLTEIIAAHPGADAQHLRQLRRNAIKEREQNRPPKSFRALFQDLKALEAPSATDGDAASGETDE